MRATLRLMLFSIALVSLTPWGGSAQEQRPVGQQREVPAENAGKPASSADSEAHTPIPIVNNQPTKRLAPERENDTKATERKAQQWWGKLTTDPGTAFAGAVVILTFGLVLVGWWQGRQLRDTVNVMRENTYVANEALSHARKALEESSRANDFNRRASRRQLRAYVGVKSGTITGVLPGSAPTFVVTIQNFGLTPAYDASYRVGLWIGSPAAEFPRLIDYRDSPTTPTIPSVLWPGVPTEPEPFSRDSVILAGDESDGISTGAIVVYIYGYIRYRDTFHHHHETRFRLMHRPGFTRFNRGNDPGEPLVFCPNGNEVT